MAYYSGQKLKVLAPEYEFMSGLVVDSSLSLFKYPVTELPSGMYVNGDLTLSFSKIDALPSDMIVNGYLKVDCTSITKIPPGLVVNGHLFAQHIALAEILPNATNVQGTIFGRQYSLADLDILSDELPFMAHLSLYQLDLFKVKISDLPEWLRISGGLDICRTDITSLPDNVWIGGFCSLPTRKRS